VAAANVAAYETWEPIKAIAIIASSTHIR